MHIGTDAEINSAWRCYIAFSNNFQRSVTLNLVDYFFQNLWFCEKCTVSRRVCTIYRCRTAAAPCKDRVTVITFGSDVPFVKQSSAWRQVLRLHSRLSYSASLYKRNSFKQPFKDLKKIYRFLSWNRTLRKIVVFLHIGTGFGFASHGVPVRFRCDLKFSNKDFKSSFNNAEFLSLLES